VLFINIHLGVFNMDSSRHIWSSRNLCCPRISTVTLRVVYLSLLPIRQILDDLWRNWWQKGGGVGSEKLFVDVRNQYYFRHCWTSLEGESAFPFYL